MRNEATRTLDRSKIYDIAEWRAWLSDHGISINRVRSIDLGEKEATAHVYKLSDKGHRYVVDGEMAMEARTFRMHTSPPSFQ